MNMVRRTVLTFVAQIATFTACIITILLFPRFLSVEGKVVLYLDLARHHLVP